MKALSVGGMPNHIHVLLSLPTTITVAKAVQVIKANSSGWMAEHPGQRSFAWQKGYGAFTIGVSQLKDTIQYIENQEQHHAKMQFDDELKMILKKHGIEPYQGYVGEND